MVQMTAGLLLALAILRPLAGQSWEKLELGLDGFSERTEEQAAAYRKNQQDAFSAIIAEKTEAYIWDKANRLGLDCTVRVTTAAGEDGIPLPSSVVIRGPYSEALARCIEEEVGIPAGKLIWQEDEEWQKRIES